MRLHLSNRTSALCHSDRSGGIAYFLFVVRAHDYWVYILTNKNKTVLYIGMTSSLVRRIHQHRSGEFGGFAANYQCKTLIYYEHYREVTDALARETQLKKWSRAKKIALIERMNPRWDDLAPPIVDEQ